jgi:diketogulonate reductase-like aldo/keto reductase
MRAVVKWIVRAPEERELRELLERLELSLRIKAIDLLLVSLPADKMQQSDDGVRELAHFWPHLERLQQSGIVRRLGVCDFTLRQLEEFAAATQARSNTIFSHLLDRRGRKSIRFTFLCRTSRAAARAKRPCCSIASSIRLSS